MTRLEFDNDLLLVRDHGNGGSKETEELNGSVERRGAEPGAGRDVCGNTS
jgi:hypothetical protein